MDHAQFVAVGLLQTNDVRLLTPSFEGLWPIDREPCFSGLLRAIDEAERQLKNRKQRTVN